MSTLAGIDLGTTYSAVAVLNKLGKPEIVPAVSGDRITASCVAFNSRDSMCVGQEAKNRLSDDPEHVVQFVKRKINEPSYRYNMFGKDYSPIDISAMILRKLKEDCTQEGEIRDVVITVPAAFDEVQRKSTMDAGTIAGLNVLGVVNEPTAAAIYYSSETDVNGNVVVYDLGGGTFDVTILNMHGKDVTVKTSKGDVHLGGVDFDQALVKLANREAERQNGCGFFPEEFLDSWNDRLLNTNERCFFYKLMKQVEQVKKSLSTRPKASLSFVDLNGRNFSMTITREDFETAIQPFIAATELLMENALEDAGMSKRDIKKILLVGGSTRVPAVQKSIEKFFGFPPEKAVNVDEAVALGAAIIAGQRKMEKDGASSVSVLVRTEVGRRKILEVCNKYFGVDCIDGDESRLVNSIILKKNTPLPCSKMQTYYLMRDDQRGVESAITESEEDTTDLDLVNKIGKLEIPLPSGMRRGDPVEVTFEYDKNQRLHVTVVGPDGRCFETDVSYSTSGTLSQSEIREKKVETSEFEIV